MPDALACRLILVGMMGSGKTTIGRLLAEATGWPYVDNDELVRRESGATARELLADGGRERLRDVESAALALGLRLPPPVIVGVAAGTILDPANRERMKSAGVVVWLRAGADTLIKRAADAIHRPFIDRDGAEWMEVTAAQRDPLYAELADITVDTGSSTPEEAVAEIRARAAALPACTDGAQSGWTQGPS